MARLYTHLMRATGCMAPGCGNRRATLLFKCEGGMVRACCGTHARQADRHLTRLDEEREAKKARAA